MLAAPRPVASRRVVVTGLGAVTAAGWGVSALVAAARAGRVCIGPFQRFPHEAHRTHVAGEVPPDADATVPAWPRQSHADRFALAAAAEATRQAGLAATLEDVAAGIFFASSTGGLFETEVFYSQLMTPGARADRRLLASHQLSSPAEAVARALRIAGPVETYSSACASAGLAIEQAFRSVRSGEVDLAVTGGADGMAVTTYAGFNALRSMDERPCRPFQADRAGMSLGEGAAVLVVESLDHARARGAQPLAEVLGAGSTCDANHMTAPHESGARAADAMRLAIADAGLVPDDIGCVSAHATATPLNDAAEFAALTRVFGDRAARVPVEASKGLVGHLLGAAGAVGAVASIVCLRDELAHPLPASGPIDPALGVDLVRETPRPLPGVRAGVSSSLGFGGANVAVVFGRWTGA